MAANLRSTTKYLWFLGPDAAYQRRPKFPSRADWSGAITKGKAAGYSGQWITRLMSDAETKRRTTEGGVIEQRCAFAAVHESAFGTTRTSQDVIAMSAFEANSDQICST
jgi:hypothetical protein